MVCMEFEPGLQDGRRRRNIAAKAGTSIIFVNPGKKNKTFLLDSWRSRV